MPITETQLLEKEAALKKVQTKLNELLNDDIPDEEQPEILDLKKKVDTGLNVIHKMKAELSEENNNLLIEQEFDDSQDEIPTCDQSHSEFINDKNRLDQKQSSILLKYLNTDLQQAQNLTKRLTALGKNSITFDILILNKGEDRAKISKELDQLIEEGNDWIVVWNNEINDFKNATENENTQMDLVLNLKKEFAVFVLSASRLLKDAKEKPLFPEDLRKKIIQLEITAKPLRAWFNGLNKAKIYIASSENTILLLKELNTVVSLARAKNPLALTKFINGQLSNRTASVIASKSWEKVKEQYMEGIAFKECSKEFKESLPKECVGFLIGETNPVEELKKLKKMIEEIQEESKALGLKSNDI